MQMKESLKSFFLAPKISYSEVTVTLMSEGWRREDVRAWRAVEHPSGQCRSQSRAHRTPVRAQVTRRQVLRRGEGGQEGKRLAAQTKTDLRKGIILHKARRTVSA